MANRKPRTTQKQKEKAPPPPPPQPRFRLDWDRWEEIIAILVLILAILTGLGAFKLSGGLFLSGWTTLLQALLGWGVYFAPILLLALAVWLFADALNTTWNIGWERPLGMGLLCFWLLAVLHWVALPDTPLREPKAFSGGGYIGYLIASLTINAFGEIGAALALIAMAGIGLILLFNISLPEFIRRIVYLGYILRHLPQEIEQYRMRRSGQPLPPELQPTINYNRSGASQPTINKPLTRQPRLPIAPPTPPSLPSTRPPRAEPTQEDKSKEASETIQPRGAIAARIIGGSSAATVPVIQREWRLPNFAEILEESVETDINQNEIRERVHKIEETLAHFGVPAKVLEVNQGPSITQFGVEPGFVEQKGPDGKAHRVKVKVSRISALQHDIELALAAAPIRIEAPVPGKNIVGIEVPNSQISMVSLRGVMESEDFKKAKSKLRIALGQDVAGQPVSAELGSMPHLLIAGATGSGKSVCVNAVIACLLCAATPAEVQFVMVDPKRVELVNFNGIPHLLQPVVVEMDKAVAALQGAVAEMDRRFRLFAQKGARNIEIYNHMVEGKNDAKKLSYLIVIVDELADLMMISPDEVEKAITRLAQMARATGIHLILATQRPSVDVVTGLIKANFPSRISFAVTSQVDSRVVLDTPGAEKLLGRGDMLYMASDSSKLVRLQGCFVSDRELEKLVTYWKDFAPPMPPSPAPESKKTGDELLQETLWGGVVPAKKSDADEDDLMPQAIEIVRQNNRASASLLQRKLRIGFQRAARLMELLEEKGIVGPDGGPTKGRPVIAQDSAPSQPVASTTTPKRQFDVEEDYDDWTDEDWEDLEKE